MIPRVFVSSTYYDLKHVRERIEKFIENYGFEPVLFESDKVTYQHGKEIDHSAYFEVGLCHIMVLIVGGRYGSPISQSIVDDERKRYDEDYISITRKEFETANRKNIPILIFVDKNVYAEYQTYKENQEYLDDLHSSNVRDHEKKNQFKFAHVDHINVFRFIDLIRAKPIKTFERVEEIEIYIKSQFAGMFYLYLELLKKQSEDNKILDTISELNNVTLRMNEMLTSVGKEILSSDKDEYERVIESQLAILIDFFVKQFGSSIKFQDDFDPNELMGVNLDEVAKVIYETALKIEVPRTQNGVGFIEGTSLKRTWAEPLLKKLQSDIFKISPVIIIKRFDFLTLNRVFHSQVLPFIKTQAHEELIIQKLKTEMYSQLYEHIPF